MKAAILGIFGAHLAPEEAALLRAMPPAGVILFGRNVRDREQLRALTDSLRAVLPPDAVLMVDQEGGRVARLRPPHWRAHPPAAAIGALHARRPDDGLRAAWITGALIGEQVAAMGFDVACAPVLDVHHPGASDVVGDRAFAASAESVAALGAALAEGLLAAGVQPVGKHAPGHGRSLVDSHVALPRVTAPDPSDELLPFIRNAGLPWLLTAHIVYEAWDTALPATLSPTVIGRVIRGMIGFDGLLSTDDLAMRALHGAPADLARQALAAGCDLAMYCAADPTENEAVLHACPDLAAPALARLRAARHRAEAARRPLDPDALAAERDRLLA